MLPADPQPHRPAVVVACTRGEASNQFLLQGQHGGTDRESEAQECPMLWAIGLVLPQ